MKIGVCIPTLDHNDWWFTHDLVCAVGYHMGTFDDEISLHSHQGALIAESRNVLARRAVENGDDYIVFLDTDMRFPQHIFKTLLDHELPVVAANCAKRRRPISPTARKVNDETGEADAVYPDKEKTGIERIDVVGTAVMAIQTDVMMQLEFPWFDTPWDDNEQRFVGEDLFFCHQLRHAGIPLYLDHDLSWEIGHIGSYTYRMDDVIGEKKLAEQGAWDHLRNEGQLVGV